MTKSTVQSPNVPLTPLPALPHEMLAARVAAREVIEKYFKELPDRTAQFTPDNMDIKHSGEIWAKLISEAVASFNQGLEQYVDTEDRRASKESTTEMFHKAVDVVGEEAFRTIAYIVASQGARAHMTGKLDA